MRSVTIDLILRELPGFSELHGHGASRTNLRLVSLLTRVTRPGLTPDPTRLGINPSTM
jgi:hypothetical protein